MKRIVCLFCLITLIAGCSPQTGQYVKKQEKENPGLINCEGKFLEARIRVPEGYERIKTESGTFGHFLRTLPLKPHGSKVKYYNGTIKEREVYEAVVDLDVGNKDLQQCADAVIRLRAEYLYNQKLYNQIHFNFTNGFKADYSKWMHGYRVTVQGNTVNWVKTAGYANDYKNFREYLETVFNYAGTLSLAKELVPASLKEMKIGDVFIQGGSPGHCVIVVDMAENRKTQEKIFLLAQSYMPAQDIHILKNPVNQEISPWYSISFGEELLTPEWKFKKDDLKRFTE